MDLRRGHIDFLHPTKGFLGDNSGGMNWRGRKFVQCDGKAKDSPYGQAGNPDPAVSVTTGARVSIYEMCIYTMNQSENYDRVKCVKFE